MRLFTGIALPAEVTDRLTRLLDHLRPLAQLRWVSAYNLHITTKFIGEWPDNRVDELIGALQPLGNTKPIEIAVNGIGWLPNPHSPRVLFAGIKAAPGLADLAKATDEVTTQFGVAPENRPFKPHLTLARIKDPTVPLAALRQGVAKLDDCNFASFTAMCFHLYRSKTGPAGSIYTQLAEIRFTN